MLVDKNYMGVFQNSGIEEITLPATLKSLYAYTFSDCRNLKTVWVERGCALDVRKYVGSNVDVRQK